MTTFILYIWLATAGAGIAQYKEVFYGWVAAGEYASEKHCQKAIQQLGLKQETARCVDTGTVR